MDKIIVSAAITGNITLPRQTPYLPITPQQIADEAVRAANAGAASVHIHARNPKDGRPTSDTAVFGEILSLIKARSDVIICISTAGARGIKGEDRIKPVVVLKPELASLDVGSVSSTGERQLEAYQDKGYKYPWEKEYLAMRSKEIFANSFEDIYLFGQTMQECGTKPEYEIWDIGWLYSALYLWRAKGGYSQPPIWLQFVMGGFGSIGADPEHLIHMSQTADKLFRGMDYKWSVCGMGYPAQLYLTTEAIMMGGNIRVGMEDNIQLHSGVLAKSNAELVERSVRLARELDREIATPDEARKMLNLKGKDKVNF